MTHGAEILWTMVGDGVLDVPLIWISPQIMDARIRGIFSVLSGVGKSRVGVYCLGVFSSILDLLFPPKCFFCRRVLHDSCDECCEKCLETLPYTEFGGMQEGDYFDFCISPFYYRDNVRKSILRFKFANAPHFATLYGKILADCIIEYPDIHYDTITWVPLSVKRKRSRGYDQAKLLALETANNLDDEAVQTLTKTYDVQPQSYLRGIEERRRNISGAFEVSSLEYVSGKTILLIDDIITTGSTLSECAKVLLEAGANNVICATLARKE